MAAIHHLRINVSNLELSRAFYEPILFWLGFKDIGIHKDGDNNVSRLRYAKSRTIFLISEADHIHRSPPGAVGLHHIAFAVDSREEVDKFYKEVLQNIPEIKIEDPPVDCPEYRDGYYATYFYDPDDLKLEIVYTP